MPHSYLSLVIIHLRRYNVHDGTSFDSFDATKPTSYLVKEDAASY